MKLEDLKKDAVISGLVPDQMARLVAVDPVGPDAVSVFYKTGDGSVAERMLFRSDEADLFIAEAGRHWAFDADPKFFKLAAEAYRINLAYLFDPMMAVHTSNVEPLPHQISAVYESMLPRQPLRYVLADDPGAGKTIMAGLYIRELVMRADARRILIVAPGSLVEQWQDELLEKFGLSFSIFSRDMLEQSHSGNPFEDQNQLIARIDQISRNDELLEKLRLTQWDLVVVDEAHKLSASYFGNKINKTKRFALGELLGSISRHLLLMTATPHNGKEEDFQLFLSLLDADRFYGKFRDGAHKVDVSDMMRRMVKEDLLRFDGTRLFPERRAQTVNYKLSDQEFELYLAVTDYVKYQMDQAERLVDGSRRGRVGFALTALQRRLASSPEAIYQSLKRRCDKLNRRLEEEKLRQRGQTLSEALSLNGAPEDVWTADEDMDASDYEDFEESLVDQASAAQTVQELADEIMTLEGLVDQAHQIALSGQDRKWEELSKLLQNTPEMHDADGRQRKLIIFTEHRDTLNYLMVKIRNLLGREEAVTMIHGGVKREERRKVQEQFRTDPDVRVLLATDAAGEGVNLQNANLMVNYDLPWNPNRLEQRFGRIHRIGQREVCHLWNMVASETREGDVFMKLFEKLEVERAALGGRVFDILGDVFEDCSLKDLLIEAIRNDSDPAREAWLHEQVENALNTEHLEAIIKRNALCEEVMDETRLFAVKEEMERAEARKLQPLFIQSFFDEAFTTFKGEMRPREEGRYEVRNVPAVIRDRQISERDRRYSFPVQRKYERICFERQHVYPERTGAATASLIHPAHPLMLSLIDLVLEEHRAKLKQGAVFVDPADPGVNPKVLFIIDHTVREGRESAKEVSRRMQFVTIDSTGQSMSAGWAPHLDLEPLGSDDLALVQDVFKADWLNQNLEQVALRQALEEMVPEHYAEVKSRREQFADKTLTAVHERLVKEINFWSDRCIKLQEDLAAGKDVRLNLDNAKRNVDEMTVRLQARKKELEQMRQVASATPVIVGGALIIPAGLLAQRKGLPEWSADAEARARIEGIAMRAVMEAEIALGNRVVDVSARNCGWDITSQPPAVDGRLPDPRHIEVKGRIKGASTITVTRNEVLTGFNQGSKFWLAVVMVDGEAYDGPFYVNQPFDELPGWAVASLNYDLGALVERSVSAEASLKC